MPLFSQWSCGGAFFYFDKVGPIIHAVHANWVLTRPATGISLGYCAKLRIRFYAQLLVNIWVGKDSQLCRSLLPPPPRRQPIFWMSEWPSPQTVYGIRYPVQRGERLARVG